MSSMFDFESFPRLETERLILREVLPADSEAVFRFRGDPIVQKHDDPPHQHLQETEALITWMADEYRLKNSIRWGVTLKGADTVIGLLGYNFWNRAHFSAGIGYGLARAYWGQGIMPEAVRAMLKFGYERMNLNRIEAHTNTENPSSIRMLEKLGFWQEGVFHDHFYEDEAFHDVSLFVLLRRDYERLHAPATPTTRA